MDSGRAAADDSAAEAQASLLELRQFMDRALSDMINATADYVYHHFFDNDVPSSSAAAATTRASRAAIEALRDVAAAGNVGGQVCVICLDHDDAAAAGWKETPCGHRFHGGCLEKWLQAAHTTCPLCRRHVVPPLAEEEADPVERTDDDDDDSEAEATSEPTDDDDDPVLLFSPRGHLRRRRREGDDPPREHARRRHA